MIKPVLHSFGYSLDFLRELLAEVATVDMAAQPPGIVNHPAWVVGHLTHSCELLADVIGVPAWLPAGWAERFGTGSVPVPDVRHYETKDVALDMLRDAEGRVTRAVERLDDGHLDQPFPDEAYRAVFPTIRHAFTQVMVGHTAFHVGQVSVWRRAMGKAPIARGFE